MFEKLGIVTNIWSEEVENGARFDELMVEFGANGFKDMEVREGDYLRNSEFGKLIQHLESVMPAYTDAEYKTICDAVWTEQPYETKHPSLFAEVTSFVQKASGLTLSYAMSHPWLSSPKDSEADTQQIVRAKKLAYLLCPGRPRLRLVDPDHRRRHRRIRGYRQPKALQRTFTRLSDDFCRRERAANRHTDLEVSSRGRMPNSPTMKQIHIALTGQR